MAAHKPEQRDLRVFTSEDVERMARCGKLDEMPARPQPRPMEPHATAAPIVEYATPTKPLPSRLAVRVTRLALLLAYPLLCVLLLESVRHSSGPALLRVFYAFFLLMFAPAILGLMAISFFVQIYFLGLFERKGMLARWNIPLSIVAGPFLAIIVVRLVLAIYFWLNL